jgi:hypothetical protein
MQQGIGSPVPLKEKLRQMRRMMDLRKQYLDGLAEEARQKMKDPNYLESEIYHHIAKKSK